MVETTSSRKRPFAGLIQNPVTVKELRSRMRGRRAFVVLTIYLLAMSCLIWLVYLAYASASNSPFGPSARDAGKVVFAAVLGIEVFLVLFVGPAFTAGAISGEKERQTYDLLRTTLLSARRLVFGKLLSALSYVFLLIFASIPLQSIAFLLGGLSLSELIISQLLVLVAAVAFAIFGLYCSSVMRTTLAASIATFAGALAITIFIPLLLILMMAVAAPIFNSISDIGWIGEALLAFAALSLAATNLPATMIVSEIFLLEENTLFFFSTTFGGTHSVTLFSPWPLFLLFYGLAAVFLYWLTVRRVRQIAR